MKFAGTLALIWITLVLFIGLSDKDLPEAEAIRWELIAFAVAFLLSWVTFFVDWILDRVQSIVAAQQPTREVEAELVDADER